ncbi:MAG: glycosyltransferase, partial [Lachnospiraceae bacterium]|nr:glycosyltransferase [Lachnospiraceae bacterium]
YLESFSYPPIEMMATGGFSVVVENDGNREYIKNEYNCLTYEKGDVEGGVKAILRICDDAELRKKLLEGGKETARSRGMESIKQTILDYYGRDLSRPE